MSRGLRAGVACGALLVLALAGCTPGGQQPSGDGAPPAAAAPSAQDAVAAAGTALADAGSARVDVELDSVTGPVRASGPARFTPFAADLTVALGTRGAQVRVVDDRAWVRFGGSDRWQPLSTGLLPVGAVGGMLHAAPGLRDVVAAPGTTDVDGVPATTHSGTVDLAAARAAAPEPAVATHLDELAGLVSPTPRFTAWLGAPDAAPADRGRLLRLRLEPQAPATGTQNAGAGVPGAVTVSFSDPGVPVEITAP
ncbi:hypothetical protein [Pseudonocardia sp. ICBG1293]|uniref:hypothetical protein n=1 Tax=Pseudonocardia sp. ICBG1293 TaxID=2844382 RepID=UPI001CCD6097|nr:hypothetical protein [Pseudonocardia sp. ICBG1293]